MTWAGWRPIANNKIIRASAHEPPSKHHLFAAEENGRLYHWGDWNVDPLTGGWNEFSKPPAGISAVHDAITVTCWGEGRIDVVTSSSDARLSPNHPYHRFRAPFTGGNWTEWSNLGGAGSGFAAPAITAERPGQLNMFHTDNNIHIVHRWYVNDRWSAGEVLDSSDVGLINACSWGPGRQDIFGIGPVEHNIVHKWYDGGWSQWESLGGYSLHRPAVSAWPGRIDVFMTGGDRAIYHKVFMDGHWSGLWESLGGIVHEQHRNLVASGGNGGPLRVYHTGEDLNIYENWWM